MSEVDEGGIRPQRVEYVRETTPGSFPTDPALELYSDVVRSYPSWEPDNNKERQDAVGSPNAQGFFRGPEDHEATVVYDLQQWFEDGSGNPQDAAYDGMVRGPDNELSNTHGFLAREEHDSGGTAGGGRRIFYVGRGGRVDQVEFPFSTEDGLPIEVSLTYVFELFEQFDVSQPASDVALDVESTSADDTTQTLTIEDEGAVNSADVALNGTTAVSTGTTTFSDIDALSLDAETKGDVLIKDGSGNTLATIPGSNTFDGDEGSLGVPALGAGSHASALASDFERFNDDSLTYNTGTIGGTDARVISGSATISNNVDADAQAGSRRKAVYAQEQSIEVGAEVAGPNSNAAQIKQYIENIGVDIDWSADRGSLTFGSAVVMSPGEVAKEANAARNSMDSTYEAETVSITTN